MTGAAAGWMMPAAAGAFAVGVLVADRWRPSAVLSAALLAVAGAAALVARRDAVGRRLAVSRRLLTSAGLLGTPARPGQRDRMLAAAGFPTEREGRRPAWRGRFVAWIAVAVVAGVGWAGFRWSTGPDLRPFDGRHVEVSGTAGTDPRRYDWGWGVELAVEAVKLRGRGFSLDVRLWLSGSGPPPRIGAGAPVATSGTLRRLEEADGFAEYLRARAVAATLSSVSSIEVRGPPPNPAIRLANAARALFRRGAREALPEREAALLLGLAIGDTSAMDPEVDEDFRASGLGHLLAVSGSNVAMVLAPVLAATARLRLGHRTAVGLLAVGFFALVTRWEPSVIRASAMAALGLAGLWAGRPRSTVSSLAVAVLGLLIVDPNLALSVGFQLSVGATAGLAALAGRLAGSLRVLPRPAALALSATVAAQAAVTPLLLVHFGVVPTVTLLANLLAFPAVAPALLLGGAASALGVAAAPLGLAVGKVAAAPLGYLLGLSDAMARFPLPAITGGIPAAALACAGAIVLALGLRRGHRRIVAVLAVVAVGGFAWSSATSAGPPEELTVTFLDVGQGDAAVLRSPDGATILIDAGPDEHQVATELAALGVRRIDLAVASHAHADHVEGFPAILARFPVSLMIEPGCPGDSPSYTRFLDAVRSEGVAARHPRGGQRLTVGAFTIEVLGPDRCSPAEEPNDDSLVLRISFREASLLFPGDAEIPAQRDLLDDGDPVQADVLKVPHHGGDTSDAAFFDAVGSRVAVVSTGPNDYGHPNAEVLAALRDAGMVIYRTDREGHITVRFAPGDRVVVASSDGDG